MSKQLAAVPAPPPNLGISEAGSIGRSTPTSAPAPPGRGNGAPPAPAGPEIGFLRRSRVARFFGH